MGIKISTLKSLAKVKYFIAAMAIVLTSAPFTVLSGNAAAAGTCAESREELQELVEDTSVSTISLCNEDAITLRGELSIMHDLTLDLSGKTLNGGTVRVAGGATVIIKNGTLGSDLTVGKTSRPSSSGNVRIESGTYNGNFGVRNGSTLVITGGIFRNNPENYVPEGYTSTYDRQTRRYTVTKDATVKANDVTIPVGGTAGVTLFTVSPAGNVNYEVTKNNVPVTDAVNITTNTAEDVTTGSVTGLKTGTYNFTVTSGNKSDSSTITVYDYDELDNLVMFVGDTKDVEVEFKDNVEVEYTVSLAMRGAAVTVNEKTLTAAESGVADITVTFEDSARTTTNFTVNVYDFDENEETIMLKSGETTSFRVEGTRTAELDDNYDDEIVEVSEEEGLFTVEGLAVGSTELNFSLETEDDETLEKTVNVFVYDIEEAELWIAKDETGAVNAELPEGVNVAAVSSAPYTAEFIGTDYLNIAGLNAGDATITYTVSVDDKEASFDVLVHVYEAEIEDEIYLIAGSSVNVNDSAIATIKNGDAIKVRISRAGDGAATLEGTTVADGVITAGDEAGNDALVFYIGDKEVGRIAVHTFTVDELSDQLLSVSGRGASMSRNINVTGENLPTYELSSSDENIASISRNTLSAVSAGDATVTVKFTGAYGEPEVTFGVKVSNFHSNARNSYSMAEGGTPVSFTVSEEYDESKVSCTVNGTSCEENTIFDIEREDGVVTVSVKEGARGGDYRITFRDSMITSQNTVNVNITVREIVVEETEYYLEVNESTTIDIDTRGGSLFDRISARVVEADGGAISNVSANCLLGYCTLRASKAGRYVVEIRYTNFLGTETYATKNVTLYVMDFEVEDAEYHVVKGDSGMHLVEALNKYWEKTYAEGTTGVAVWQKPGSNSEYAFVLDDNTEAGDYDLKFYAYAGPDMTVVRDTKTVTVHVYEMIAPEEDYFWGEVGDRFPIEFGDKNQNAYSRHTWDEGSATGLPIFNNTAIARRAGKYVVTFTDYMANREVVGTYTATFEIIEPTFETRYVAKGELAEIVSDSEYVAEFATDTESGLDYIAEDGVITVDTSELELGEHNLRVAHDFPNGKRITIKDARLIVYEVNADEATDPNSITEETLKNLFDAINEAYISDDWDAVLAKAQIIYGNDGEGLATFLDTLLRARAGYELNTEVVVENINETVSEEDVTAIDAVLEANGISTDHIDYYDISVILSTNDRPFGKLHQLDGAITVAVAKAEDPATGYARQYFVIAKHGDSEEAVMLVEGKDFYILDGQIYVISDKFSTFAVAYKDSLKPKAPDTGSFTAAVVDAKEGNNSTTMAVAMIAVAIAAVVTMAGAVEFAKARK